MDTFMSSLPLIIGSLVVLGVMWIILALIFRRVVDTNRVHIVQRSGSTISYGTNKDNGNVYYAWPSWVPGIGVKVIDLPVSVFDLNFENYTAYDKDRVPFKVDITAFFRIADTNVAAESVESFAELQNQLMSIVQGAVRTILASHHIDNIMLERSTFGESFTREVAEELGSWGVIPVKNMELMDIRDTDGSQVIENIMAKKKSFIEMESRTEVANNRKQAEIAEINAKQETDIRQQEADQRVGERTAEKDKLVGIANQKAQQEIKTEEALTAAKEMEVKKVEQVKAAEIEKEKQVVAANQDKETTVIKAEGRLTEQQKQAEGIKAEGEAKAFAEKEMQLAPVKAQIELAEKIAELQPYMEYLIRTRAVEAGEKVGIAQAAALEDADLKVIANTGDAAKGVSSIGDIFSSKGGTNLTAMLEGLAQGETGKAILDRFFPGKSLEDLATAITGSTDNGSVTSKSDKPAASVASTESEEDADKQS